MRPVITPEESGRLDATAADPVDVLMERAGLGVALRAVARFGLGPGDRVAVLAGTGNNGGDGYVAARHLRRRGVDVTVHALAAPRSAAAAQAAQAAADAGVRTVALGEPDTSVALVVDALFGVGFHGALPDAVVPWTEIPLPTLAVDVPSGLDAATGAVAGPAFRADATVTFHALKTGHLLGEGPDRCGPVDIVDIGLSGERPAFVLADDADAPAPARPRHAHKWSAGSVAVVGGSPGLTGAALLAASAALHAGAGAVSIVCPGALQPIYAAAAPAVMQHPIGVGDRFGAYDATRVLDAGDRYDVMVLGPGLGPDVTEFVTDVVLRRNGPLLVDADGLNGLAAGDGLDVLRRRSGPTIITPHGGEFRRLTGTDPSWQAAANLPDDAGVVVVLKGYPTFVFGAERWAVDRNGPELATIGTGDVLSGVIGALWARGLPAEVAARSGAHRHGRAGADLAATTTVTADRLAEHVGRFAW